MEYLVACNWDPELIDKIDFPEVTSVFGGLPDTIISSGRPSYQIKNVSEDDVKEIIKKVHEKGWSFDYNINASCLENKELTLEGYKEIVKYLEWLCEHGVDALTITNTNLIGIVKKNFPKLKINISTYQKVSNVSQAKRFEDMGADMIMLSEHINRDFKMLQSIREAVKCKLTLIANVGCVYNCPNMHTHANSISHSGSLDGEKIFMESYHLYCLSKRMESPEEIIKIRWIRPEDVSFYEDIGINMLKIIDRNTKTEVLSQRVKAYCERSFDGNLLYLLGQMVNVKTSDSRIKDYISEKFSKSPGKDIAEKAQKVARYGSMVSKPLTDMIYLDNKMIPQDFIQRYKTRECSVLDCNACKNCSNIANKAVRISDEELLKNTLSNIKQGLEQIKDGSLLY
jgi:collagenase-like PrtC family protease